MQKMRWQFLALMPLIALWVALAQPWQTKGPLSGLENLSLRLKYALRGPINIQAGPTETPVKLVYVDIDQEAVSTLGERPWHRGQFANIANSILQLGGAKAVGFDFIFSNLTATALVPHAKLRESNEAFGSVLQAFPGKIVLGASYTGVLDARYMRQPAHFPLLYKGHTNAAENPYPEGPSFPLIGPTWGTLGLINVDEARGKSAAPQWLPIYAHYAGPSHTLNIARGQQNHLKESFPLKLIENDAAGTFDLVLKENDVVLFSHPQHTEKTFYTLAVQLLCAAENLTPQLNDERTALLLVNTEAQTRYTIPLTDNQLVHINYFSPWQDAERNPRLSALVLLDAWEAATAALEGQESWNAFRNSAQEDMDAARILQRFSGLETIETAADVIPSLAALLRTTLEGALVLVGPTDPILQDLAPTPLDPYPVPKVGVHGNVLKMISTGAYFKALPWGAHVGLIALLGLLASALTLYTLKYTKTIRTLCALSILAYFIAVFISFNVGGWLLPFVAPLGASLSCLGAGILLRLVAEEKQKRRVQTMFGTYLSPELVKGMVEKQEEPELGGTETELTAFFSDIQNFSAFSEILCPTALVQLMNNYLSEMTDVLMRRGCTIDKYIGDAIVGMFGAPVPAHNHAQLACIAAADVQKAQATLREHWQQQTDVKDIGTWPTIVQHMHTRIGLNSGAATVGNMGSNKRFAYTMMGDTVNVAARCESSAKAYGVYTMVTGATTEAAQAAYTKAAKNKHSASLEAACPLAFRFLDNVIMKGRTQPTKIYELLGYRAELNAQTIEATQLYAAGMHAYTNGAWADAIKCFTQALPLEPNNPTHNPYSPTCPSAVMLKRTQQFQTNPPSKNWDGSFALLSK